MAGRQPEICETRRSRVGGVLADGERQSLLGGSTSPCGCCSLFLARERRTCTLLIITLQFVREHIFFFIYLKVYYYVNSLEALNLSRGRGRPPAANPLKPSWFRQIEDRCTKLGGKFHDGFMHQCVPCELFTVPNSRARCRHR